MAHYLRGIEILKNGRQTPWVGCYAFIIELLYVGGAELCFICFLLFLVGARFFLT